MLQLVREWPPGFGGVERVAHALAIELGGSVTCLRRPSDSNDDLSGPVSYRRFWLPSLPLGHLLIPLPSYQLVQLLFGPQPLLGHLPCPTVLALVLLAHLFRPRRPIYVYWHAFLAPRAGLRGWFEMTYQAIALRCLRRLPVITTSPSLRHHLQKCGLPPQRLSVLPCSLPPSSEVAYCAIHEQRQRSITAPSGHLIAIGRLDSYKRFDLLISAMSQVPFARRLDVLGDGPQRQALESLAHRVLAPTQQAFFHGRVSEVRKQQLLATSDLLVLPADLCNEAFGIVQLEAMASGIPALAFRVPRSGMHWVSHLPSFPWSGQPTDLANVLQRLLGHAPLWRECCLQAHKRYHELFATAVWRSHCQLLTRSRDGGS